MALFFYGAKAGQEDPVLGFASPQRSICGANVKDLFLRLHEHDVRVIPFFLDKKTEPDGSVFYMFFIAQRQGI